MRQKAGEEPENKPRSTDRDRHMSDHSKQSMHPSLLYPNRLKTDNYMEKLARSDHIQLWNNDILILPSAHPFAECN